MHQPGSAPPEAARLASLRDGAPPARQRQLLGDTVLRCAVRHAMRQLRLVTFLARRPPPRSDTLAAQAQQVLAMSREALHLLDEEPPPSTHAHERNWPQARQRVLQALWPLADI